MMHELDRLGREAREQLGVPPADWLRHQSTELRRAFALREGGASRRVLVGALSLAVLVAAALVVGVRAMSSTLAHRETVVSSAGSGRRLGLADGSSVMLEAHTRARLTTEPTATRCVVEVGTATFDVVPQGRRVFAVIAGDLEVRVVGTRFSVSHDLAGVVEVRVVHGVVQVKTPARSAPVELRDGDYLRGDAQSLSVEHPAPGRGSAAAPTAMPPATSLPDARATESEALEPLAPTAPKIRASHDEWQQLYRERKYAAAIAAARGLGIDRLFASLAAKPLLELADAARLARENELALQALASIQRRFPASGQAQDATFLSGRILASQGQVSRAQSHFEAYLSRNAEGPYSLEALGRLVELYAASKDARAKLTASAYLQRAPRGPYERLCHSVLNAP